MATPSPQEVRDNTVPASLYALENAQSDGDSFISDLESRLDLILNPPPTPDVTLEGKEVCGPLVSDAVEWINRLVKRQKAINRRLMQINERAAI